MLVTVHIVTAQGLKGKDRNFTLNGDGMLNK